MPRLLVLLLSGLAAVAAHSEPAAGVVSLDYCADQYALELLPRANILALSPDAEQDFAYLREQAAGVPKVRPVAEDVLALQPTMVIRSYGGGPFALAFFERAGIPVVQVPFADDIDGIRGAVAAVAGELGVPERGAAVVADMDARLAAIDAGSGDRTALYLSAGGATSGPGTLVHALLVAAGYRNYSIFADGPQLFGYLECDDWDAAQRALAGSDANRRWQAFMRDYLATPVDPDDAGSIRMLEPVFFME